MKSRIIKLVIAVIMVSMLSSVGTFADNCMISPWALEYVGQVQAAGIMDGIGNNRFAPAGFYTIEQSITTLMRLYAIV